MWNELVKDGEIVTEGSEGLINSAGVLAKKGKQLLCCGTKPDSSNNLTKYYYYYNGNSVEKYLIWGIGNQLLCINIPTFFFNAHPNMIVIEYGHPTVMTFDFHRLREDLAVIRRHCHVM